MLIPKMSMTLKAKYSHKHQSKCRKILLVWKGLAEKIIIPVKILFGHPPSNNYLLFHQNI